MGFIVEARNGVVWLRLQGGAGEATGRHRLEQRQASALDQIVDEGGDEHGFTGARQTGDAEPNGRGYQSGGEIREIVNCDPRVVGKGRQGQLLISATHVGVKCDR